MTRWLRAAQQASEVLTKPTELTKPPPDAGRTEVLSVLSVLSEGDEPSLAVDFDAFEETAAIIEFDGGLSRSHAELLAAQAQGYSDASALLAARERHAEGAFHPANIASGSDRKVRV